MTRSESKSAFDPRTLLRAWRLAPSGLLGGDSIQQDVADRAAAALAPETGLVTEFDMAGFGEALGTAAVAAVRDPSRITRAGVQLASDLMQIPQAALAKWLGREATASVAIDPKDRRFADPTWSENPGFYALRLAYLATSRFTRDLVTGGDIHSQAAAKAELATDLLLDALAPTNFPLTNPTVIKRAFETAGGSLARGARNFLDDLRHNGGRPRQVDASGFEVGRNLATTPSKVVYRNELMELLQYEPQTETVHTTPLLMSPPWINKYYVMDLAPGRSFIEWAVQHGRTVFAISYRNPTKEMSGTTMDDYLIKGPKQAFDVITEITGADKIDIVGLCLGGALTAITAAYLIQSGDTRVGSLTLLNTALDYTKPGQLGVFTDQRTVDRLEKKMRREGTLAGKAMAGTFDILRANDLIFSYVVSNWLLGEKPPAFDILAWNADSTRMPAAMHTFYLRNFYVQNNLSAGKLELAGKTIDLSVIKSPTYVVSAINDHIVLWQAAYKTVELFSGPVRFVLGSGGHIAGIVSPPGPKVWHLVIDEPEEGGVDEAEEKTKLLTAEQWKAAATRHQGSWWEDWAEWSAGHAGPRIEPPALGSEAYPVLGPGPGDYVRT